MISSPLMPETLLKAQNLKKYYKEFCAVSDFSLTLQKAEIVSLLGPNGAGKSTIIGMLYGAYQPSSGEIFYRDIRVQGSTLRWYLSKVGVVTQDNNLDPDLTVRQNLEVFAGYYGKFGREAKKTADRLLDLVYLSDKASANVEEISGGMKRRLILARALIGEPEFVFLDEPTTGLDPDARQQFWKLILDLKALGVSILLTTHYMDETERLADRLILMQAGKEVSSGNTQDLIQQKIGTEIFEIYGVEEKQIEVFTRQANLWYRSYGGGFLISGAEDLSQLAEGLQALNPNKLIRRLANLEDVFLKLTGDRL